MGVHPLAKETLETLISFRDWAVMLITKKNSLSSRQAHLQAIIAEGSLHEAYIELQKRTRRSPEDCLVEVDQEYETLSRQVDDVKSKIRKLEIQARTLTISLVDILPEGYPEDIRDEVQQLNLDRDNKLDLLYRAKRQFFHDVKRRRVELRHELKKATKRRDEEGARRIRQELNLVYEHTEWAGKLSSELAEINEAHRSGLEALMQSKR